MRKKFAATISQGNGGVNHVTGDTTAPEQSIANTS
jgi:hypothetical protein